MKLIKTNTIGTTGDQWSYQLLQVV